MIACILIYKADSIKKHGRKGAQRKVLLGPRTLIVTAKMSHLGTGLFGAALAPPDTLPYSIISLLVDPIFA